MDGPLSPSTFSYLDLLYDQLSGLEVLCQMIQKFYYAGRIGFVKRNGHVIRKLEIFVTGKKDESTYLKKIIDHSYVSSILMETFDVFLRGQISNAQKEFFIRSFIALFICHTIHCFMILIQRKIYRWCVL